MFKIWEISHLHFLRTLKVNGYKWIYRESRFVYMVSRQGFCGLRLLSRLGSEASVNTE